MKKKLFALFSACLILCGCNNRTDNNTPVVTESTDAVSSGERVYTSDVIYVTSYNCGYVPPEYCPPDMYVFIETEEQLAFAEERFNLKAPDDLSEEEKYEQYPFSDSIQRMKENFPISEYNYFFTYDEVSSSGYRLHTDRVVISGDEIRFEMDDGSFTPEEGSVQSAVMGGFFHIAAVPKRHCENITFSNVLYPDRNDMTQDKNYSYNIKYGLGDTELAELYGNEVYLFNSEKEFSAFLDKAEEIKNFDRITLEQSYDFEKVSLAVRFFTRNPREYIRKNIAGIENGEVFIDFDFMEIDEYDKEKTESGAILVTIPKSFLG